MNKLVLIGDIISSRKIINRHLVQKRLYHTIRKINRYNIDLTSPYTLTLGDEFQAVFHNANRMFFDSITILTDLYPVKIRFSFGYGSIETPINTIQAIGMDGPAFHYARHAMNELKKSNNLYSFSGIEKDVESFINHILSLISHTLRNWKANRYNILRMLMENINISTISKKLKISDTAVYKNINAGAIETIISIFEELTVMLNKEFKR